MPAFLTIFQKKILNRLMKKLPVIVPLLIMGICLIPAFLGSGKRIDNGLSFQRDVDRFQTALHNKMAAMKQSMTEISEQLARGEKAHEIWENLSIQENQLAHEGKCFLISRKDSLLFWSDNTSDFPDTIIHYSASPECVFLGNAWYLKMSMLAQKYCITGLLLIKYEYTIENRFLENRFQEEFQMDKEVKIGYPKDVLPGSYFVTGPANERLFFLHSSLPLLKKLGILSFTWLWYLLALGFCLIASSSVFKYIPHQNQRRIYFLVLTIFLFVLRICMIYWQFPTSVYALELFHPKYFATSDLLPSLGDLILNSIILFYLIFHFYQFISIETPAKSSSKLTYLYLVISLILLILFSTYPEFVFRHLILDSRISFEVHNLLDLSQFSFFIEVPVILLFACTGLLMDKWIMLGRNVLSRNKMLMLFLVILTLIFSIKYVIGFGGDFRTFVLLLIGFTIICIIRYSNIYHFRYSIFLILILLFSIYSSLFSAHYTSEKIRAEQKFLAVNLADEHDAIAELLLADIEKRIVNDRTLIALIFRPDFNKEDLDEYLGKRYFNDYMQKYEFQSAVCDEKDSILIKPDIVRTHCYSFFEDMVSEQRGLLIPNTNYFYYLDNRNGRISYFAAIPFSRLRRSATIFINLDSRLVSDILGYPELLLDEDIKKENPLSGYSYAKYYDGQLIMKSGAFPYSLSSKSFAVGNQEFSYIRGEYDHLIYRVDSKNLIVLSRPVLSFFDRLVAFSYVFIFYFIIASLLLFLTRVPFIQLRWGTTLKTRIQYSMISLLCISLFLVGGGSVYFSIRQYHNKHSEILGEKMQSVYSQLLHELGEQKNLNPHWHGDGYDNLEELLKKFSNVFYTDINLYNAQGQLVASSRPEIFNNSLAGRMMNPFAYHELSVSRKSDFIHQEQIGSMSFLSAYVPFANNDNKFLAYLNLPYFTRQNVLSEEVSSLVLAVVNISILLILLSSAFTILIANQITRPLSMIQLKFSEIKLGKKYEKVIYKGSDEIAGLVKEYNRMVEELENNIELLARSERETAWREMAKQVAHEIKNPLTPMKLSVQHLERAWDHKADNFGDFLKRFINTISEQIDNLSFIATAFSNFAMMPRENNELVDFLEIINNTLILFNNNENVEITHDYHGLTIAHVFGDREQLSRMLVNLFKNALQAIPQDRIGRIRIGLKHSGDSYVFMISDNGTGIPEHLRHKMFEPNFTTKSSGMGLGLAMSKKVIENMGGDISFETVEGQGSTFFVRLPMRD
jgi:two-component system, NtrC family, nitrogen regulation sensor histidine kinase NtrY